MSSKNKNIVPRAPIKEPFKPPQPPQRGTYVRFINRFNEVSQRLQAKGHQIDTTIPLTWRQFQNQYMAMREDLKAMKKNNLIKNVGDVAIQLAYSYIYPKTARQAKAVKEAIARENESRPKGQKFKFNWTAFRLGEKDVDKGFWDHVSETYEKAKKEGLKPQKAKAFVSETIFGSPPGRGKFGADEEE